MIKPIPGTLLSDLNETDQKTLFLFGVKIDEIIQEVNSLSAWAHNVSAGANKLLKESRGEE